MIRLYSIPRFLCPYDSLFIDDIVNIKWGIEIKSKNSQEERIKRSKTFPHNALILFTDGSGLSNNSKGFAVFSHQSGAILAKRVRGLPKRFLLQPITFNIIFYRI